VPSLRRSTFRNSSSKQEEEEDEESVALVDALTVLAEKWPEGFHATDVAELINNNSIDLDALTLGEFLYPGAPAGQVAAPRSVGKRLAAHVDEPVKSGILSLRKMEETTDRKKKGTLRYHIHMDPDPETGAKATPPKPERARSAR
jgi:hypothetical protein